MRYLLIAALLGVVGCVSDGRPSLLPNPDANLNKTSAQFAADAAKRQYESDAPRGDSTEARAEYELMSKRLDVVNLAGADWKDVEVWINHLYVVYVPTWQQMEDKKFDFTMFYDRDGNHFETHGGEYPLQTVEIYHDGKLIQVTATAE